MRVHTICLSDLLALPELLWSVLHLLDHRQLSTTCSVSELWNGFGNDDALWRQLVECTGKMVVPRGQRSWKQLYTDVPCVPIDCATVQQGVDRCRCHHLVVLPGLYREAVKVESALSMYAVANSSTVIEAPCATAAALSIQSTAAVHIEGIQLRGAAVLDELSGSLLDQQVLETHDGPAVVEIIGQGASSVVLSNCSVNNANGFGLTVRGGCLLLKSVLVHGCRWSGVCCRDGARVQIKVSYRMHESRRAAIPCSCVCCATGIRDQQQSIQRHLVHTRSLLRRAYCHYQAQRWLCHLFEPLRERCSRRYFIGKQR